MVTEGVSGGTLVKVVATATEDMNTASEAAMGRNAIIQVLTFVIVALVMEAGAHCITLVKISILSRHNLT